jgi:hypothetical protein
MADFWDVAPSCRWRACSLKRQSISARLQCAASCKTTIWRFFLVMLTVPLHLHSLSFVCRYLQFMFIKSKRPFHNHYRRGPTGGPWALLMEEVSPSEAWVSFFETTQPPSYSPPWEPEVSTMARFSCSFSVPFGRCQNNTLNMPRVPSSVSFRIH